MDTEASTEPFTSAAMIAGVLPSRTVVQAVIVRDQPETAPLAAKLGILLAPVHQPLSPRVDCRSAFHAPSGMDPVPCNLRDRALA